jgi:ABC-2 type transport system ATP-binding protein
VALAFSRNAAAAHRVLQDRALVLRAEDLGATAEVELAAGVEPEILLRALVLADVGLSRFEVVDPSLESIFIAKVGADAAHPVAREFSV